MTYSGLVANLFQKVKDKRVFLIFGGDLAVRLDSLRIFRYRIARTVEKSVSKVLKIAFFLHKTQDLSRFLYNMPYDLKVFYWEEGLLEGEELEMFLGQLVKDDSRVVIMDETGELLETFRELYPKNSRGLWIDCSKIPTDMQKLLEKRLAVGTLDIEDRYKKGGVIGRGIEPVALEYLKELPYLSLFNVFNILDELQLDAIDMNCLRKHGLLKGNLEAFLANKLLTQGKNAILKYNLKDVDGAKFFGLLRWYLIMMLRIKTMVRATAVVCASKLEISKFRYDALLSMSEKYELRDLYKKLYLLLSLGQWRRKYGALLLLLMYW